MVPTITSGRWVNEEDTNKAVVSSKLGRDDPTLAVGRQIELEINDEKKIYEIIGVYTLLDERAMVVNRKYLDATYRGNTQVSSVRVRFDKTKIDPVEGAKILEKDMKRLGFDVAYSLSIDSIRQSTDGQFNFMIFFLLIMAAMVAIVGGLGLAGTMSLNVMERTREFGVMRSIGSSDAMLRRIVIVEGVCIGVLSWLIAIPLSVPMGFGFGYALGTAFFEKPLEFIFSPLAVVLWLGIVVVISILASLAPMASAAKLTIRETLAYE
jgi:putative ABC transport system permease protein